MSDVIFYSRGLRPAAISNQSGKPYEFEYKEVLACDNPHLEVVGKRDTYGLIQAERDGVDLKHLIQRFTAGDVTALDRARGFYADISEMPTNIFEAAAQVDHARYIFDQLTADMKARFGGSFEMFLKAASDPSSLDSVIGAIDPEYTRQKAAAAQAATEGDVVSE